MYRLMSQVGARPVHGAGRYLKCQQYRQSGDMGSQLLHTTTKCTVDDVGYFDRCVATSGDKQAPVLSLMSGSLCLRWDRRWVAGMVLL
jgi:hypothetical protein